MNASLNSLPAAPALSIEAIVEQVFRIGFLSLQQENLINELLFQRRYSEADLEMLDRLTLALLNQQVEADKPSVAKAV